jgi:2-polyprenyl-3-methyl-5-hydroxy-6-metoxy-1,4-benzoquinol methylase
MTLIVHLSGLMGIYHLKKVNKKVIKDFYAKKSTSNRLRWTSKDMLHFEKRMLKKKLKSNDYILDLGAGDGELAKLISSSTNKILAVDNQKNFARFFTRSNENFVCQDLLKFNSTKKFDFILLFGVITCLNKNDENALYRNISKYLKRDGFLVVKNQVTSGQEIIIDSISQELGSLYSSRYPNLSEQINRLIKYFRLFEVIEYPDQFNKHVNTRHVMFFFKK